MSGGNAMRPQTCTAQAGQAGLLGQTVRWSYSHKQAGQTQTGPTGGQAGGQATGPRQRDRAMDNSGLSHGGGELWRGEASEVRGQPRGGRAGEVRVCGKAKEFK